VRTASTPCIRARAVALSSSIVASPLGFLSVWVGEGTRIHPACLCRTRTGRMLRDVECAARSPEGADLLKSERSWFLDSGFSRNPWQIRCKFTWYSEKGPVQDVDAAVESLSTSWHNVKRDVWQCRTLRTHTQEMDDSPPQVDRRVGFILGVNFA